jgi:hypothetical protein
VLPDWPYNHFLGKTTVMSYKITKSSNGFNVGKIRKGSRLVLYARCQQTTAQEVQEWLLAKGYKVKSKKEKNDEERNT